MTERTDYGSDDEQEAPRLDLAEAIAQTRREWKEAALERAGKHFAEARGIELDYDRRGEILAATDNEMTQKEFERWEDTVADELELAEKEIRRKEVKLADRAEVMQNMIAYHEDDEIGKVIETQSAKYYVERDNELRLAIRKNGGTDTEKDLAYLNGFYPTVMMYFDFKHTNLDNIQGYGREVYEQQRTEARNDTIRYLNGLNQLARKYRTRAFTPRDFWASDLCDTKERTLAIATVMHYDKVIVEEYCMTAFKKSEKGLDI